MNIVSRRMGAVAACGVAIAMALGAPLPISAQENPDSDALVFVGSSPGSQSYGALAGIAKLVAEKTGRMVEVQSHGGHDFWLPMIASGEADFGVLRACCGFSDSGFP